MPKTIRCEFCGQPKPWRTNQPRFCSRQCQRRSLRKRKGIPQGLSMWRSDREQPCRICGKPTLYRYCGKECREAWWMLKRKGAIPEEISKQRPIVDVEDLRAERVWERKGAGA